MSCLWNVHPVWLFKCIQSLSYLIGMNIKRTIGRAYCTRLAVPVSVSVSIIIPNCEEKKTTNGTYITTQVSGFIPPSHQLKLGAFCALEEVISWGDAGGGVLEIDQWQICDSGSQQLEMMKLFFFFFFYWECVSTCTHLYQLTHLVTQQQPPCSYGRAAAAGLQGENRFLTLRPVFMSPSLS